MFDKDYLMSDNALARVFDALSTKYPEKEISGLEAAYDRVLAQDIISKEDLPGFDRSTVDGYAVASSDTFGAKETMPAYLQMSHEVFMGDEPDFTLAKGAAAKIPTGGMLPKGADAVVMLEHVQDAAGGLIEVLRSVSLYENVIRRGDDITASSLVLDKGRRLKPQDVGALAGIGITEVEVFKQPVVSIISTGDEIVPASESLKPGQIRDINSYTLSGLIRRHGGMPKRMGIFKDDYNTIRNAMASALAESDMVLLTGGTSAGTKDMTSEIINDIGSPGVLFHGVSIKPGKPMIGAVVNNTAVFGLPGHPAATVVCFNIFIKPVLRRICGMLDNTVESGTVRAVMSKSIASAAGREDHIRVSLELKGGVLYAAPVLGKSGLITTLVKADGIVIIPGPKLGLQAGEETIVRMF
ncbi:MAG: molybdopterin molybdotransferase MoeA [Dissulfurispiraceae bacterium]|jgi:molybdopterin molybdotransferase|nr:molybdopterin molybdotransferase MoeA [Dissulfurispiraceae bacterium]